MGKFVTDVSQDKTQDEFAPLPEIQHVFRPDQEPGNLALSTLFVGLTVAPWAFLILVWFVLGANVTGLFSSLSVFSTGLLFTLSLASVIGLFSFYWIGLSIFELIGYGSLLGPVTLFFGRQALLAKKKI